MAKERRRALVRAVSEITGENALYQGAPSLAFKVGGYTIDRHGTLSGEAAEALLGALAARGFVCDVNHEGEVVAVGGTEEGAEIMENRFGAAAALAEIEEGAEIMENGFGAAVVIDNTGVFAAAAGTGSWQFRALAASRKRKGRRQTEVYLEVEFGNEEDF
ncbi:MAG: hypothetical protein LBK56_12585 [Gracilibacteraceae bacterium]|jgi:hypothetical protein|nr:hypothetical protein [Gracilibacteraceae bacterium]